MQFVPEDGVYTYFRYDGGQTVMVVMNTAKEEKSIDTQRFSERYTGFANAKDVMTNITRQLKGAWKVPAKSIWIMELGK